jgi:hypothetical protein
MNPKRSYIPEKQEYKNTLTQLIEKGDLTTLIAVRMGCELGMSRIEIVHSRVTDIDRYHKRGLWIETAKQVRRGYTKNKQGKRKPKFEMRKREIPINPSLYQLLKSYVDETQKYILHRKKGNIQKPFSPRYINTLYEQHNIIWSTHRSRHYFKNQVMDWMRRNRQVDEGLIKHYMGHKKSQTQEYGSISWDYMRDVIDQVFE